MDWIFILDITLVILSIYQVTSHDVCVSSDVGHNNSDTVPVLRFCTESSTIDTSALYLDSSNVSAEVGSCVCQLSLAGNTSGELNIEYISHANNETTNMFSVTVDDIHVNTTFIILYNNQTVSITLMTEQQKMFGNDTTSCVWINSNDTKTLFNARCFEYTNESTTPYNVSGTTDEITSPTTYTTETTTVEEANTTQAMNETDGRSLFNIGNVIAVAGGGFVILVTMVTLICVCCCKRKDFDDYHSGAIFNRDDVHMAENKLYDVTNSGTQDNPNRESSMFRPLDIPESTGSAGTVSSKL